MHRELSSRSKANESSTCCRYKIAPVGRGDTENGTLPDFDPFKERQVEHPTTDMDTLTHLLKASLGTGILGKHIECGTVGLQLTQLLPIQQCRWRSRLPDW